MKRVCEPINEVAKTLRIESCETTDSSNSLETINNIVTDGTALPTESEEQQDGDNRGEVCSAFVMCGNNSDDVLCETVVLSASESEIEKPKDASNVDPTDNVPQYVDNSQQLQSEDSMIEKLSATSDDMTEKPSATSDVMTEKPSATSDVMTEKPSTTSDVMTEKPSATSDVMTEKPSATSDNVIEKPSATSDNVIEKPSATSDVSVCDNDTAEEMLLDLESITVTHPEHRHDCLYNIESELTCSVCDNVTVTKSPSKTDENLSTHSDDGEEPLEDDFLGDPEAVYEPPPPELPVLPHMSPDENNVYDENSPLPYFDNMIYITCAWKEFAKPVKNQPNFLKGCKWAPDGTCLLTASEDTTLRIFDLPIELHCQNSWPASRTLPDMKPALEIKEGDRIYDYAWYPLMSSSNHLTCCIASTSSSSPIHLWDAFTGELRASYLSFNCVEELIAPYCVTFDPFGRHIYCGFKNEIRVFDINRPGKHSDRRVFKPSRNIHSKVYGIASAITVSPENHSLYAIGTFTKLIALYSEPTGKLIGTLEGHKGGITHLQFSPDGTKLYSGGRNDGEIRVWDVRRYKSEMYVIAKRTVTTNQRIYFDVSSDGNFLVSGTTTSDVLVWDTRLSPVNIQPRPTMLPIKKIEAHSDCVNGVSIHQQYPILATTSGQRHFPILNEDSDDEEGPLFLPRKVNVEDPENCVKLWWIGRMKRDD